MGKDESTHLRRRQTVPAFQLVLNTGTTSAVNGRRSLSVKGRLAYYKCGRWMTHNSRRMLSRIRLYEPPSKEDVTIQAGVLCRDFIYQRLKKQGLLSFKLELHPSAARSSDVAMEIQTLAAELEKMYPNLYHNICRQLNMVMSSEEKARMTFQSLADAMFCETYITWGRIVALFLIAAELSAECIQQGHPEFVRCIVEVFTEVTKTFLSAWIVKQGGWNDITRVFRTTKEMTALWAVTGVGAILGFVITVFASLVL